MNVNDYEISTKRLNWVTWPLDTYLRKFDRQKRLDKISIQKKGYITYLPGAKVLSVSDAYEVLGTFESKNCVSVADFEEFINVYEKLPTQEIAELVRQVRKAFLDKLITSIKNNAHEWQEYLVSFPEGTLRAEVLDNLSQIAVLKFNNAWNTYLTSNAGRIGKNVSIQDYQKIISSLKKGTIPLDISDFGLQRILKQHLKALEQHRILANNWVHIESEISSLKKKIIEQPDPPSELHRNLQEAPTDQKAPRVFISYSWEESIGSKWANLDAYKDYDYKKWIKALAIRLREDGVNARLDDWHRGILTWADFMDREVRNADWVLLLCSPSYQEKVYKYQEDDISSGVGIEHMLTAISSDIKFKKVIPVVAKGDRDQSIPSRFIGVPSFDLSEPSFFEETYISILSRLFGKEEKAPPLGRRIDIEGEEIPALRIATSGK